MTNHTTTLIHHAAHDGSHSHPASSLSAIRACLEAGARIVEIDISPMADGAFLLTHDSLLEEASDGAGRIAEIGQDAVQGLQYVRHGEPTGEKLGLLHEALAMIRDYPAFEELQLDLKPYLPLGPAHIGYLKQHLLPVAGQARITTLADWSLLLLARELPGVQLGFDPFLYLDFLNMIPTDGPEPRPEFTPRHFGAFGYWDDHPLAAGERWGAPTTYLALRSAQLQRQVIPGLVWYIRGTMLGKALFDGFNWIEDLQKSGYLVDAWTLDPGEPGEPELAATLVAAGVDRVTTNAASELAKLLGQAGAEIVY